MPYLIPNDLYRSIQRVNLDQVTGSNYAMINSWLLTAQEKAASYLTQKYQVEAEFTETTKWDKTQQYAAGDRVYLDAAAYDTTHSYLIGDFALQTGNIYIATANTTGAFTPGSWQLINPQYTLYYGTYPYPPFDIRTVYNRGDKVYYMGKVYTALQPSAAYDHTYLLQIYGTPPINYFPGTPGYPQWDSGAVYDIPAGTPITNPLWTQGDNRGQQIMKVVIDIVLYYAHERISPMNIPELRKEAYKDAVKWLIEAGDGIITPKLPIRMPLQGNKIRYSRTERNINSYSLLPLLLTLSALFKL